MLNSNIIIDYEGFLDKVLLLSSWHSDEFDVRINCGCDGTFGFLKFHGPCWAFLHSCVKLSILHPAIIVMVWRAASTFTLLSFATVASKAFLPTIYGWLCVLSAVFWVRRLELVRCFSIIWPHAKLHVQFRHQTRRFFVEWKPFIDYIGL